MGGLAVASFIRGRGWNSVGRPAQPRVIGGRVDIDHALMKGDPDGLVRMLMHDLPRALGPVHGKQLWKQGVRKKRGHAERAAIFRGDNRPASSLVRGDEIAEVARGNEGLIAQQKNGGVHPGVRGEERVQPRAD